MFLGTSSGSQSPAELTASGLHMELARCFFPSLADRVTAALNVKCDIEALTSK